MDTLLPLATGNQSTWLPLRSTMPDINALMFILVKNGGTVPEDLRT